MAKSLNSTQIIGNLGADPELSQLPNGDWVATMSVATTEKWVDKSTGEERERTDWHRISAFRGNAEVIKNYLRKGSPVFVQGAIRYESWEDKDSGQTKYATKIIANNIILLGKNPNAPVSSNHPEASWGKATPPLNAEQPPQSAEPTPQATVPPQANEQTTAQSTATGEISGF